VSIISCRRRWKNFASAIIALAEHMAGTSPAWQHQQHGPLVIQFHNQL
jgi:hypothetical protein